MAPNVAKTTTATRVSPIDITAAAAMTGASPKTVNPEQPEPPLSPVRSLSFDDEGVNKNKKKGFFSKGKNIFKKLGK